MATEVQLPELGESVTEGTVTQWLKAVGDQVAVDEPLLEVSTDKVDTEVPSPVAGTLLEIKAEEDETVEVGAVLAVIGDEGEGSGGSASADTEGQAGDDAAEASPAGTDSGDATTDEASSDESGSSESSSDDSGSDDSDSGALESGQQKDQPSEMPQDPKTDEGATDQAPSEEAPASRGDASPSESGASDSGAAGEDSTDVTLPALGESVTEGTVTQWLKSVGDEVAVDEPLLEVSTDKVDTEVPSPVAGTLLAIKVDEDETVEVGSVLAVIGSKGSQPAESQATVDEAQPDEAAEPEGAPEPEPDAAPEQEPQPEPEPEQESEAPPEPSPEAESSREPEQVAPDSSQTPDPSRAPQAGRDPSGSASPEDSSTGARDDGDAKSYVTPLVRKLAAQHGVELSELTGTGVGGRIRKQDILEAAEAAKKATSAPAAASGTSAPTPDAATSQLRGKTEKLSRLRKVIAARMVESLQMSAQLTTVVEVDVTAISRLRDKAKSGFAEREGVKLSFLPFFAKAAIDALKAYPQVNASIDTEAGEVTYHDGEHLGVAVDTERGLLVPVIKDAGDLSIAGLARKIADLAARTRDSKISPDELSGGTFTLTNTGSRGALFDTPIINQPQVAILGTGTVVKRPVVISDERLGETIAVRQMVYLALTYDHRLVDGADAARFLTSIKQRLEDANFESELGG